MADEQGAEESLVKRRSPAVKRIISKISPSSDRRVRIVGKIAKKGQNGQIVLEDSSGKVEVFFDNLDVVDSLEKNYSSSDRVLVVGLVVPQDSGRFDISGEILARVEESSLSEELIREAEELARNG